MSALFDEYKKIDQSDHEKAIAFLIEKCNASDYDAPDEDLASEFLRLYAANDPLLARQGNLMSDVVSALMYASDTEYDPDSFLSTYPEAIPVIEKYCYTKDDPGTYARVGNLFLDGIEVPKDEKTAFKLFSAGANIEVDDCYRGSASSARAQAEENSYIYYCAIKMAEALRKGRGTEKDVVKAFFTYAEYYDIDFYDESPFDEATLLDLAKEALSLTMGKGDLERSYEIVRRMEDLIDYDDYDDEDDAEEKPPLGKSFIDLYKELIDFANKSSDASIKKAVWYQDCLSRIKR